MGLRLDEMGVTGLTNYLRSVKYKGRSYQLQKGRIRKIIETRYPKLNELGYNKAWIAFCNNLQGGANGN